MKKLLSYFILWFVFSAQTFAAAVSPIGSGYEGQSQYVVELKSINYFYRLNIYDDNHVLLDSTIQFTKGCDLEVFIFKNADGDFEIAVAMTMDDERDEQDVFSFDGSFLSKISR